MSLKRQGVISGVVDFNNIEYVEIFDKDYKYLYGEIDDLFVAYGTWVEYDVVNAPRNHPKNCNFYAQNISYVNVKSSKAPTSDEFRSNDMNIRAYNKVDFFQYDNSEGILSHKSTIACNIDDTRQQYFNEYYGAVIIPSDAHRRLREHAINRLDVMMNLIPSGQYSSGAHWEVVHYIHQGKCYSVNGFLSITGHVLRGPGGVVRNRCDVIVPTDSLRPLNLSLTFGNSPIGTKGLGALARRFDFGTPPSSASSTTKQSVFGSWEKKAPPSPNDSIYGLKANRCAKDLSNREDSRDPFNEVLNDQTEQSSMDNTYGQGFGSSGRGFGRSSTRPIGLGRLTNAHF